MGSHTVLWSLYICVCIRTRNKPTNTEKNRNNQQEYTQQITRKGERKTVVSKLEKSVKIKIKPNAIIVIYGQPKYHNL